MVLQLFDSLSLLFVEQSQAALWLLVASGLGEDGGGGSPSSGVGLLSRESLSNLAGINSALHPLCHTALGLHFLLFLS